ncbi:hypothetical protein BJX68DRAFT_269308 [Aspergillus pseudodeflectus]|uniref:Xylanolytic transcriptional activator regulatory domain-containing protein n=1 Tax=Aspergillus pseudodeflectus TaxID=176178 RepID=A0ABR4JYH1_9EURO
MSSRNHLKRVSCSRCQTKKIRLNATESIRDATNVKRPAQSVDICPGKHGPSDDYVLANILRRLDRLENHCELNQEAAEDSMSISSHSSDVLLPDSTSVPQEHLNGFQSLTAREMWDLIKNPETRPRHLSDAFSHLRKLETLFFTNERCINAIESIIDGIEIPDTSQPRTIPTISKEMARDWVQKYFDHYQFPGFRVPLEKNFLTSVPDLLEIPHVQLDCTSRIIYYNVLLHGILLSETGYDAKSAISQYLYRTSLALAGDWVREVKYTAAGLSAACFLIAMALEGGDIEQSWKMLGEACKIARALGYFHVDSTLLEDDPNEPAEERNRKRFEFWHLLRTDCLFRLSFGKPALIPKGSWEVNFPQHPSITGIEDENSSTRVIEIHFLASMRQTLVMLKYLEYMDTVLNPDEVDGAFISGLIEEVNSIRRLWKPDEILTMTTNHIDSWFSVDILLGCYKMFIILDQARTKAYCQANYGVVPLSSEMAVQSLKTVRTFMSSASYAHWGVSLVLLHQFVPLLTVCTDVIIKGTDRTTFDPELLSWVKDFVEKTADERVELRPVMAMMRIMIQACERSL